MASSLQSSGEQLRWHPLGCRCLVLQLGTGLERCFWYTNWAMPLHFLKASFTCKSKNSWTISQKGPIEESFVGPNTSTKQCAKNHGVPHPFAFAPLEWVQKSLLYYQKLWSAQVGLPAAVWLGHHHTAVLAPFAVGGWGVREGRPMVLGAMLARRAFVSLRSRFAMAWVVMHFLLCGSLGRAQDKSSSVPAIVENCGVARKRD